MKQPKLVGSSLNQIPVIWVPLLCRGEWPLISHHIEQNDSSGEEINHIRLVGAPVYQFRRHVGLSPKGRLIEPIARAAIDGGHESEVGYL